MTRSELLYHLQALGFSTDADQTRSNSYAATPSKSSIIAAVNGNRLQSGWKTAKYVVAKNDSTTGGLEECLRGWRAVTDKYKDQFLCLETEDGEMKFFDSYCREISFEEALPATPPVPTEIGYNKIFYGAPGTGKSYTVEEDYVSNNKCFRITFHPDTDYASFIGCYKPTMGGENEDNITYDFVPQVFLNAYIYAWNHPDKKTFLVIEELNRGNCAQIFGDVFQLLDRRVNNFPGYSKYTINADTDVARFLKKNIGRMQPDDMNQNEDVINAYKDKIVEIYEPETFDFSIMAIPSNLYILATMNTSDQSLFPIDSAFKRRWEWEYIAVNYSDARQFKLNIDDRHSYNWSDVLHGLNDYIKGEKQSTNKILGNRFVQAKADNTIDAKTFRDKVLFFLFNDVFKDDDTFSNTFFGADTREPFFEALCVNNDTVKTIAFIENVCRAQNLISPENESTEQPASEA